MKEEDMIMRKFGKENHFSVPDGYFDSFADKLMEQLPEQDAARVIDMRAESWWRRLPLRKVAAAVCAAAVMGGGALWFALQPSRSGHSQQMVASQTAEDSHASSSSEYGTFDQMADYVMMDNQDCYASLVAEN